MFRQSTQSLAEDTYIYRRKAFLGTTALAGGLALAAGTPASATAASDPGAARGLAGLAAGEPVNVPNGYLVDLPAEVGPLVIESDGTLTQVEPVRADPAAPVPTIVDYRRLTARWSADRSAGLGVRRPVGFCGG